MLITVLTVRCVKRIHLWYSHCMGTRYSAILLQCRAEESKFINHGTYKIQGEWVPALHFLKIYPCGF